MRYSRILGTLVFAAALFLAGCATQNASPTATPEEMGRAIINLCKLQTSTPIDFDDCVAELAALEGGASAPVSAPYYATTPASSLDPFLAFERQGLYDQALAAQIYPTQPDTSGVPQQIQIAPNYFSSSPFEPAPPVQLFP